MGGRCTACGQVLYKCYETMTYSQYRQLDHKVVHRICAQKMAVDIGISVRMSRAIPMPRACPV